MGGTNVHVVIEAPPESVDQHQLGDQWHLFPISARTVEGLEKISANLACYIAENPSVDLADVAFTLQVGRASLPYRRAITGADAKRLDEDLKSQDTARTLSGVSTRPTPDIIFMFPGSGSTTSWNVPRTPMRLNPSFASISMNAPRCS